MWRWHDSSRPLLDEHQCPTPAAMECAGLRGLLYLSRRRRFATPSPDTVGRYQAISRGNRSAEPEGSGQPRPGCCLGKRKGLAAAASANPSFFMVAGAGFEPATFGLRALFKSSLEPKRHEQRLAD
jgi:hypothetical protein